MSQLAGPNEGATANAPAHYHCPHDCEKPQPIVTEDGERYCGRCWFEGGRVTRMFLCTPDVCR